jgi:hypothetical protein
VWYLLGMTKRRLAPEVTIWTDARHAPLAGQLMNLMASALKPIGVGGLPVAEVNQLAKELNCDKHDDLRKMCIDRPAAYLLLTTLQGVLPEDLHVLAGQGTTVLTLEPIASDLQGLSAAEQLGVKHGGAASDVFGRIIHVPAFRQSPGFLAAADPNELLGDRRLVSYVSEGRPEHGSLFTRLLDGWQTILSFSLLPEMIDASLIGPLEEVPDSLEQLTGGLAAHARMPGSQTALIEVSDTAANTRRTLRIQGDGASLRIADASYRLLNPQGEMLDQMTRDNEPGGFVDVLAFQWRRLLDQPPGSRSGTYGRQLAEAMACCLACHLSIRTGQPESPGKLLHMNR